MIRIDGPLAGFDITPTDDGLVVMVTLATGAPIITPEGQMGMVPVPYASAQFGMTKQVAIEQAEAILAAANDLPDPEEKPDIAIAHNMSEVTKAAAMDQRFRGSQR